MKMEMEGDREWILSYDGFDPESEGLRESLCTLGNGVFATRGAIEEAAADDVHYPGTYLAGGYDRLVTEVAGRPVENEDLVNMPNWLCLTFRPEDGDWVRPGTTEVVSWRQELLIKEGILRRVVRYRDGVGRETTIASRRMVHMASSHLAAIEWTLMAENWSGRIKIRSALDGTVTNQGVKRYRGLDGRHLEALDNGAFELGDGGEQGICLRLRTRQSRIEVAQAARTRVFDEKDRIIEGDRSLSSEPGCVGEEITVEINEKHPIRIEKIVAFYNSRDKAISEALLEAQTAVRRADGFDALLRTHELLWRGLWRRFDVRVGGNAYHQMVLRLHIFHVLVSISPNTIDCDVGAPARGLHGEAYRGHIFWDEMHIFYFLNFRLPGAARTMLVYRYRRLDEARAAAKAAGFAGAMYPWQSASNGREETQVVHLNPESGRWLPDYSHLQRHANAAIAYDVWKYVRISGDQGFLSYYGAEMLFEIARFWASIATYNEERGRYEIHGVMGPDEYHDGYPGYDRPGVNNNAYTNVMAAWVLRRALETLDLLTTERRAVLWETLELTDAEINQWRDIGHRMFVPFHGDGIISQFEGYDELEEFDWEGYRKKYGNIQRLDRILEAEGDSANRYKLSKQADTLMLFYLFPFEEVKELFASLDYAIDWEMGERNIAYYLRRTSHGSTLSQVVHAWITARHDPELSRKLFISALESDIEDIQGGTTKEGIHLGVMTGTVDLVMRCYAGLRMRGNVLHFNPAPPKGFDNLSFGLHFQGGRLEVELADGMLKLAVPDGPGAAVRVGFRDEPGITITPGDAKTYTL